MVEGRRRGVFCWDRNPMDVGAVDSLQHEEDLLTVLLSGEADRPFRVMAQPQGVAVPVFTRFYGRRSQSVTFTNMSLHPR
jgi:hypothetical protein